MLEDRYIGNPPRGGRQVGDVVYGTAPPDSSYIVPSGQFVTGCQQFVKKSRLWLPGNQGLAAGVNANARITTTSPGGAPSNDTQNGITRDGDTLYWMGRNGTTWKKVANGLGTGAITQVKAAPSPFYSVFRDSSLWKAGSLFYRQYQTASGSGNIRVEYATDPAGTWTVLDLPDFSGTSPATVQYFAAAGRWYAVVYNGTIYRLYWSANGISGWTLVTGAATSLSYSYVFEASGGLYWLSATKVSKITAASPGAFAYFSKDIANLGGGLSGNAANWLYVPALDMVISVHDNNASTGVDWRLCQTKPAWLDGAAPGANDVWLLYDVRVGTQSNGAETSAIHFALGEEGEVYLWAGGATAPGLYRMDPVNHPHIWIKGTVTDNLGDNYAPPRIVDFDGYIHRFGGGDGTGNGGAIEQVANGRDRCYIPPLDPTNGHTAYLKFR